MGQNWERDAMIKARSAARGLSEEEYMSGNLLGVVLNNVDVRSDSQYQYYTSYYTYYAPSEAQGPPAMSAPAMASTSTENKTKPSPSAVKDIKPESDLY